MSRSFVATHPDEPSYKAVAFAASPSAARAAYAEVHRRHGEWLRRSRFRVAPTAELAPLLDCDVVDFDAAVHVPATPSTPPTMALTFYLGDLDMEAEDWDSARDAALSSLARDLAAYDGGTVEYRTSEENRGLGADWVVVVLTVLSVAGSGFFAVPAAHKRVRESLEEWRRIRVSVDGLARWLGERRRVVGYPKELLFLDALHELDGVAGADEAVLLDASEVVVPDDYGGFRPMPHSHFTFVLDGVLHVYAYDKQRRLLWSRRVELGDVDPGTPDAR